MEKNSSKEMKRYNQLHGEIDATYHLFSMRMGISDSVLKILYAICSVGDSLMLNDICHNTGLSKQTINSAIRNLEKDDIVYLLAVNGKSKKVHLTEKGKQIAANTAFRLIEIENEIFESWTNDEVQNYLEFTERFWLSLKEKTEQLDKENNK